MKHLSATILALGLASTAGAASAQNYPYGGQGVQGDYYDWARVIRVQPVYGSQGGYATAGAERCTESRTYVDGRGYDGGYRNDGYRSDGYRDDGYRNDGYRNDGYRDPYGRSAYGDRYGGNSGYGGYGGYGDPYGSGGGGSQIGGTMAQVIGGLVGAAVGSQVGGGSARYATSAIGSMMGSMAGRQIYEQNRRNRAPQRVGIAVACDPVPVGAYERGRSQSMYDVTYEYGNRTYTTRTTQHPGERIRVRVDVRPE